MNVRSFVYNQRTRDQVLNSLNQILKLRKAQKEEEKANDTKIFHPHYVVLITDETLILDHVIMEFFREDPTELGCSIIYVADVLSSFLKISKRLSPSRTATKGNCSCKKGFFGSLTSNWITSQKVMTRKPYRVVLPPSSISNSSRAQFQTR